MLTRIGGAQELPDTDLNASAEYDFKGLSKYRDLRKLFCTLPKDMFISQLIRDLSGSDTELEALRDKYFYRVMNSRGDLPFDLNCGLKRGLSTRSGDPVT